MIFNIPTASPIIHVAKSAGGRKPEIVARGRVGYFARRSREIYFAPSSSGRGASRISAVNIDTNDP